MEVLSPDSLLTSGFYCLTVTLLVMSGVTTFTRASHIDIPAPAPLASSFSDYTAELLTGLEPGTITFVEGNNIKQIHGLLHQQLVETLSDPDWSVTLIDQANMLNPHLVGELAFERGLFGGDMLRRISLSRPFQVFQSIDIIKRLADHVQDKVSKHLIVVTDISAPYFNAAVKQEDPNFPIPQLESFRLVSGLLQKLAVQGHTILVTDATEAKKSVLVADIERINPASLRYSAKVHVRIIEQQGRREVELLNHPYLPPRRLVVKQYTKDELKQQQKQQRLAWEMSRQQSLDDVFDEVEDDWGSVTLVKKRQQSLDQFF